MPVRRAFTRFGIQMATVARWFILAVAMAMAVGSACALFLWSLDRATELRFAHAWLLFLLPAAGVVVGCAYHLFGKSAEGGNNLIMEQIHQPGGGVPRRMAPLVLGATVVTHLFGGSAGREGTAVQMGGSIASAFARLFGLEAADLRILLMAGVAAGFGAVFGTPLAGTVFALEVIAIGQIRHEALIPCLMAAIAGDWTCHAWGIGHTHYHVAYMSAAMIPSQVFHLDWLLMGKVIVAAVAFGCVSTLFSELSHWLSSLFKQWCPYAPLRPALGGLIVIGLVFALGTRQYLGLGVTSPDPSDVTIASLFSTEQTHPWVWWWKILFTAVTLGAGFKGGEVTPLFFIGAALGNALAGVLGAPLDLFAALGFVAIFAGATNTPFACTIMGIELFGAANGVYLATACFIAYLCSGHSGIYLSQRVAVPKNGHEVVPPDVSLKNLREMNGGGLNEWFSRLAGEGNSTCNKGENIMSGPHHIDSREIGMIRIYLKPGDKRKTTGLRARLAARPLYRELVQAAKGDGILNAVAHHTHYGYSNGGVVGSSNPESVNPDLTMCVELVGQREQLENFCRNHGGLLADKVIIYKQLEHWRLHAEKLEEAGATPEELKSDAF